VTSGSREIELPVAAEIVWGALVAPGRRDWYYGLLPEGVFAEGGQVRWVDGRGRVAIEDEVVGVRPPEHLALRTRFLFAPIFAALPPHQMRWDVEPAPSGCRVTTSWQANEPLATLLESDADGLLQALRLALDPAARAEIARKESIGEVTVRDVTRDAVEDYLAFFDHEAFRDFPQWQSCYCMETHRTQSEDEWALRTRHDNRRDMSAMIAQGKVSGLMAYVHGTPIGWCNYGETTHLSGVMHRFGLEAKDHDGVGSIACFVIAAPYRGHGVASRLLDAAVDRLRAKGLRTIEAYPRRDGDTAQSHYRGPLSMFLRAGFVRYRETEHYLVVRKSS
jgi:ribosomal protein S18 acetylase RimI-like enzyme